MSHISTDKIMLDINIWVILRSCRATIIKLVQKSETRNETANKKMGIIPITSSYFGKYVSITYPITKYIGKAKKTDIMNELVESIIANLKLAFIPWVTCFWDINGYAEELIIWCTDCATINNVHAKAY